MNSAIERLLGLRVCDIMTTPVATIQENCDLHEAARRMTEHGVSGLPVVDVTGRCVGMLSASDFTAREGQAMSQDERIAFGVERSLAQTGPHGSWQIESNCKNCVRDHMTSMDLTIGPSASLINAARLMCREHVHRLVIVDEQERPVGLISSLDLVAAMVAAVEE